MIGRRELPEHFERWNRRWGAPYGKRPRHVLRRQALRFTFPRAVGPFGFQPDNSITRRFEYPWAFHAVPLRAGMRAVEIGGSLAGLQFALASAGVKVVNVDPGERATVGWPVNQASINRLNRAFRTDVELRNCFIEEAGLEAESFDLVYSISTIEHIPVTLLASILGEVNRILKPGGRCVLTVDLFLDLEPFSYETRNITGANIDIQWLVEQSGLDLEQGDPAELYGFPEFDPKGIMGNLFSYQYGTYYPSLAQAFVLVKRA
ncbi:MAG: methyltransferase domain-containing protein [Actinobacteria bacterium]|nr:methyltransferase domain-containing protein [Actinomycetota bacterium]